MPTRKILLLLVFVFILLFGILFFYTAVVPLSKMKKVEARVLDIRQTYREGTRSRSYHLLFTVDNPIRILEINYSTQTEATMDSTFNTINVGQTYTFYINQSDLDSINAIDYNGTPIYRKPKGYRIFMGTLVSLIGLIGIIVILSKKSILQFR